MRNPCVKKRHFFEFFFFLKSDKYVCVLYIKLIPNEFVTDRWGIRSAAVKNSVTPRDKSDRIFHTCEGSVPWEIRFNIAVNSLNIKSTSSLEKSLSERIYAYTGMTKNWGLSHTSQEKSGQSYTFCFCCWKKRANQIPSSAEKGAHPYYAIYRTLPPSHLPLPPRHPPPPPPNTHTPPQTRTHTHPALPPRA